MAGWGPTSAEYQIPGLRETPAIVARPGDAETLV